VSATGYRLVELSCPACGAGLEAEGEDVVYYCVACRNGHLLDAESARLAPVEVAFAAAPSRPAERHLPFWLLPAEIEILERLASGGGSLGRVLRAWFGAEPEPSGKASGTFAVPAFDCDLERRVRLTARFTAELPRLGERLGEKLTGGTLTPADARQLAEFTLLAEEAGQPDTLRSLRYELRFGAPRLFGVPFAQAAGGVLADAFFGL
jgi:hypothetical protein